MKTNYAERIRGALRDSWVFKAAMGLIAFLNIVFAVPQAWTLWHTRDVSAISALTCWLLLTIQWGFSLNAWTMSDRFIFYSGFGSGLCTVVILLRIYGIRLGWF